VLTDPAVPITMRHVARGAVVLDLAPKRRHIHPQLPIGRDPANRIGAEP